MSTFPRRCTAAAILHEGIIALARVDHHEPDDGDFGGCCSICGAVVWTDNKVERFRALKPMVPVLCCLCVEVSAAVLDQACPGLHWWRGPIPDLAKQGRFN